MIIAFVWSTDHCAIRIVGLALFLTLIMRSLSFTTRRSGSIAVSLPTRGKSLISSDRASSATPTYILRLNHKPAAVFPFDILEEIITHYIEKSKETASTVSYSFASTTTDVLFRMVLPLLGSSRAVREITLRRFFKSLSLVSYAQDIDILDILGTKTVVKLCGYVR